MGDRRYFRFGFICCLLAVIGLHVCLLFSSWPHHQGDTWFFAFLMDSFVIGAVGGISIAIAVESA